MVAPLFQDLLALHKEETIFAVDSVELFNILGLEVKYSDEPMKKSLTIAKLKLHVGEPQFA